MSRTMHATSSPRHRTRSGRRATHVVLTMLTIALVAVSITTELPVAAQARAVTAVVHTSPPEPQPGDDVAVEVTVDGCPVGPATVEIYLTTSDGRTQQSELMTRRPARTTLLWRTRASLELGSALAGWYGVRIICGSFRPLKEPMTNTLFAVGASVRHHAELEVTSPSSVRVTGDRCTGTSMEYVIVDALRGRGSFEPDGSIPVSSDGSWSGDVAVDDGVEPGAIALRLRCVSTNAYDRPVYVYFDRTNEVVVPRPA